MKLGRNERCHCGSRKKYKNCHLRQDEASQREPHEHRQVAPGVRFVGSLLGKRVAVTSDPSTTSPHELRRHLARFNLAFLLRRIGELHAEIGTRAFVSVGGAAVHPHSLPYLALVAIESSSDDVHTIPTQMDIAEAARIFNGLDEPQDLADESVFEFLIRMGYAQFAGPDLRNSIARTWLLYETVWPSCVKAASFDISQAIRHETGLSLRQVMALGFAYSGRSSQSKQGYWVPYSDEAIGPLTATLGIGADEHRRFLNWIAASYAEIRELGAKLPVPAGYEKYRLSPFLIKPVVRPDQPPDGVEHIHLVPAPQHLIRRVSDGLYHALATASDAGGRENPFRTAFGFVFQAYVGRLLEAGCNATVLPEWDYGPKGVRVHTPDWLVLEDDRLVVVEVKQSALTLATKVLGSLDTLASDLQRTLLGGARQLVKFKAAVEARAPGLERLTDAKHIELMLVTHDPLPWANWVLREHIAKAVQGAEAIHFCSVDDFENLQRYCWRTSMFSLLAEKRAGTGNAMSFDFREWLAERGKPPVPDHPVLAAAFADLSATWGLPAPDEQRRGQDGTKP